MNNAKVSIEFIGYDHTITICTTIQHSCKWLSVLREIWADDYYDPEEGDGRSIFMNCVSDGHQLNFTSWFPDDLYIAIEETSDEIHPLCEVGRVFLNSIADDFNMISHIDKPQILDLDELKDYFHTNN